MLLLVAYGGNNTIAGFTAEQRLEHSQKVSAGINRTSCKESKIEGVAWESKCSWNGPIFILLRLKEKCQYPKTGEKHPSHRNNRDRRRGQLFLFDLLVSEIKPGSSDNCAFVMEGVLV